MLDYLEAANWSKGNTSFNLSRQLDTSKTYYDIFMCMLSCVQM